MLKKFYNPILTEAGCDEAGRGCLAGPVVAAAVILPKDFHSRILNDSKKLSEKQRTDLAPLIKEKALSWAIAEASREEIDNINILNASLLAMHRAVSRLKIQPGHLLIDGNRFKKHKDIPHTCIVKGDATYMCIAAASVLAKTYRDELMLGLHKANPHYSWDRNKGYATKEHIEAIHRHGPCSNHRKTFMPSVMQVKIVF